VTAAGPGVVPCRTGCTACCLGPFDISAADARLLGAAVAALPPQVGDAVRQRAGAQLERGHAAAPGWCAPWLAGETDEATFDAMCEALAADPCPALDPVDGACLVHAARPATCRLMGLGLVTPDGDLLENLCPIQDRFPGYAALAPTPLDLMQFEVDAAHEDLFAMAEGWHATTVAGAVGR
jgi:Fe-S-cluster containining protein